MPKCLRLGWCISFTPTPFEQGVWKRNYLETVQGLHISPPTVRRLSFLIFICLSVCLFVCISFYHYNASKSVIQNFLYIQTLSCAIFAIYFFPQTFNKEEFSVSEVKVMDSEFEEATLENGESRPSVRIQHGRSLPGCASVSLAKGPPPWRDSDRHPTDTIRFNYLDNLDPIEHARQL